MCNSCGSSKSKTPGSPDSKAEAKAPAAPANIEIRKGEQSGINEFRSIFRPLDYSTLPDTDHRVIGRKLDLFSFHQVSPGMVYWHNNGLIIKNELMAFIRSELTERGYVEISTPAIASTKLWRVSGHWDHYKEDMFLTAMRDESEYGMKPMNCPSTFLIFKSKQWSYRDMPARIADFDPLYRNELSGVSSGLFRVKSFQQDDAHVFMMETQIESEMRAQLDLLKKLYGVFNLTYKLKISTMPQSHMGSEEQWTKATDILMDAVKRNNFTYEVKPGEGAFYGPKIDVDIKDSMGREWQCATFQLDFQMPGRFELTYKGSDGKDHTPIVLHRVIYGSLERFIGIITEHYQGKFPAWIAPVQVLVAPVSDRNLDYATNVGKRLKLTGRRVEVDASNNKLGYKVREAQGRCIPYTLIVGPAEEQANLVSVRTRAGTEKKGVPIEQFESVLAEEISSKKNEPSY